MKICDYEACTGCGACANKCPKTCIEIKEDKYGELHPFVNEDLCIHCNTCVRVCPANKIPHLIEYKNVYAAWRKNFSDMTDSASGGVAASLSEMWIKKGGIVYGTEFDANFNAIMKRETDLIGVEKFKGSKYVQSYSKNSFKEVQKDLKENKKVLYFGTPCQIDGLYSVVDRNNENLFTVEILCHGVSSNSYLKEELQYIKENKKIDFDSLTFRTNRWMMDFCFGLWKGEKCVLRQEAYMNEYFRGFLTGLTLRESCYQCHYKHKERLGDIVIGDFIGFGKYFPYEGGQRKASLIITYTNKGEKLLTQSNDLKLIRRTMEEAIIDGTSLKQPFARHKKQKDFRQEYLQNGFIAAIHKTVGDEIESYKSRPITLDRIKMNSKLLLFKLFKIKINKKGIYHGK